MTKRHTLQDKLAESLDRANRKEAAKESPAVTVKTKAAQAQVDGGCTKLSVSLFNADVERLEAIRAYMAKRGEMFSCSQAVKLALRCTPLSDDLQAALDQVRSEDGRKW